MLKSSGTEDAGLTKDVFRSGKRITARENRENAKQTEGTSGEQWSQLITFSSDKGKLNSFPDP